MVSYLKQALLYSSVFLSLPVHGQTFAAQLHVQYQLKEQYPGLVSLTQITPVSGYCAAYHCEQGELSISVPNWMAYKRFTSWSPDYNQLYAYLDTAPRSVTLTHGKRGHTINVALRLQLFGVEIKSLGETQGQNIVSHWFAETIEGECQQMVDINAEPYWRRIVWLYALGEKQCQQPMAEKSGYDSFFAYTNLTLGYSLSPLYIEDVIPEGDYYGEAVYTLGSQRNIDFAADWYSHREIRMAIVARVSSGEFNVIAHQ